MLHPSGKGSMVFSKCRKELWNAQRRVALCDCSCTGIASYEAPIVIIGILSIQSQVKQRISKYIEQDINQDEDYYLNEWQEEWAEDSEKTRFINTFIPDMRMLTKSQHGEVNIGQGFSRHGCLMYFNHFKICEEDICAFCPEVDTVEPHGLYMSKVKGRKEDIGRKVGMQCKCSMMLSRLKLL